VPSAFHANGDASAGDHVSNGAVFFNKLHREEFPVGAFDKAAVVFGLVVHVFSLLFLDSFYFSIYYIRRQNLKMYPFST